MCLPDTVDPRKPKVKANVVTAPPSVRGIYDTWAACDAAAVVSGLGALA